MTSSTDFLNLPCVFVRVYRLPERDKLTNGYCFGGGHPISFLNVDWFEAAPAQGRAFLSDYIKQKKYFQADQRYLVLGDHPDLTFTIDPEGTHA